MSGTTEVSEFIILMICAAVIALVPYLRLSYIVSEAMIVLFFPMWLANTCPDDHRSGHGWYTAMYMSRNGTDGKNLTLQLLAQTRAGECRISPRV